MRDLYEAEHPHEGWQLDGKGSFALRFVDGTRIEVTVLTVLDDHSRAVLAAVVAVEEDIEAAVTVTSNAMAKWGLPDRFQFDRGLGLRQPRLPRRPRRARRAPQLHQASQSRMGRQDRGLPPLPRPVVRPRAQARWWTV